VKDLAGRTAFEATDDFTPGLALLDPALVVVLSARVDPQTGEHDAMERGIRLTVATPVEATELPASRGTLDGTDTAQRGERRLTVQPFRIVPHRDQQSDRRIRTDPHHLEQLRGMGFHMPGQTGVHLADLLGELADPVSQ
jgi:hypothetical protein